MKKIIITSALFCLSFTSLFAQNLAGKQILSGNLSFTVNSGNASPLLGYTVLNYNSTFLYGKIRESNSYTAFGFNLGILSTGNSNNITTTNPPNAGNQTRTDGIYTVGPVVQFGKYLKIFDKLYYSPYTTLNLSGTFSTSTPSSFSKVSGLGIGASFVPINFVYQVSDHFLFGVNTGNLSINYRNLTTSSSGNPEANSYTFSINSYLTSISSITGYYIF